jgi:hypothetical protein
MHQALEAVVRRQLHLAVVVPFCMQSDDRSSLFTSLAEPYQRHPGRKMEGDQTGCMKVLCSAQRKGNFCS